MPICLSRMSGMSVVVKPPKHMLNAVRGVKHTDDDAAADTFQTIKEHVLPLVVYVV